MPKKTIDDFETESGLEPDYSKGGRVGEYRFSHAPYKTIYVSGSTIGTLYVRVDFHYGKIFLEAEELKQLFNSRGVKVTKWKVDDKLEEQVLAMINGIIEIAYKIREDAKDMCPHRSGRLKRSISVSWSGSPLPITSGDKVLPPVFVPGKFSVVVGSNVEYAPHIEFGTKHMGAEPFLRSAFFLNYMHFTDEMRAALQFKVVREKYVSFVRII